MRFCLAALMMCCSFGYSQDVTEATPEEVVIVTPESGEENTMDLVDYTCACKKKKNNPK